MEKERDHAEQESSNLNLSHIDDREKNTACIFSSKCFAMLLLITIF